MGMLSLFSNMQENVSQINPFNTQKNDQFIAVPSINHKNTNKNGSSNQNTIKKVKNVSKTIQTEVPIDDPYRYLLGLEDL